MLKRQTKRNFLNSFLTGIKHSLFTTVKADVNSYMTTQGDTGVEGQVKLDNAVRMVYSKEIEYKALPLMRFEQFATRKTELTVQPGDTISMMTFNNLKRGGKLKEGVHMNSQAMSSSMKQIKVTEHGNAITVTELLLRTSFTDIMAAATNLLGRDYALTLDCELRDTALSGTNRVYARKSSGATVSSRAELDATCTFKVSTVKDGIEILATHNASKYRGTYWICFVHPHQSRTLRDDPAWINASDYGAPEQLFNGEIGRIDDTRFIETTIMPNGFDSQDEYGYDAALVNGSLPVYQSVIFGDNYYGLATALPVELRDNGVIDFGREHGLGWYSIFGSGILHDENGVVIETV